MSNDWLLNRAQAFVDRKYVARSDARQKEMGLAYIEAERQDLAREIARFVQNLIDLDALTDHRTPEHSRPNRDSEA